MGIELQPEYAKISEGRIRHWMPIGTDIDSEAEVGGEKAKEGETVSIFVLFPNTSHTIFLSYGLGCLSSKERASESLI